MKYPLYVLLAASLIANVVLAWPALRRSVAASSAPASINQHEAATASSAATENAAVTRGDAAGADRSAPPAMPAGAVWKPVNGKEDLARVVSDLRSAGFPGPVIRAVLNELLHQQFAARRPGADAPYWKAGAPHANLAQLTALNRERTELLESLLGPDGRPSSTLDQATREQRYGRLSNEKIDAIARIERNYQEMTADFMAGRATNSPESMESSIQAQRLLESEKLVDLAKVLTPEELQEYERRNSNTARQLAAAMRNVDVSEREYIQLFDARKAFDAANPPRATMNQTDLAARQRAQQALNEQARTILGENRFYAYLENSDFQYAQVARTLGNFSIPPATAYQVYRMQGELTGLYMANSGASPQSRAAELQAASEAYNRKLESLVGPQAAEALRKQGTGMVFRAGPTNVR